MTIGAQIIAGISGTVMVLSLCVILFWGGDDESATPALVALGVSFLVFILAAML